MMTQLTILYLYLSSEFAYVNILRSVWILAGHKFLEEVSVFQHTCVNAQGSPVVLDGAAHMKRYVCRYNSRTRG